MRIGVLTTSYPRFEGDPAGVFVRGFARALAARGHSLDVLAPEPAEPTRHGPPRDAGVAISFIPYLRPRAWQRTFYGAGVPDNVKHDPRSWLGLAPFCVSVARATRARMRGWDAVVSHWALPSAIVAGPLRGGRPHLAVLHSADVHLMERLPGRRRLACAVERGASSMWFSSEALRAGFLTMLPGDRREDVASRTCVSAMGIEPPPAPRESRQSVRRELDLRGFTVLTMSRLVAIKGLDVAIDALAGTAGMELVIAGEGPERARLAHRAQRRRAPVRFVGALRGEEKARWLRAADAFAMPSRPLSSGRTEGAPTSLLEAMASGLPVVASDTGGIGELVTHARSGLLVAPEAPEPLRGALERLAADRWLRHRLGRSGRAVAQRYRWSALAPRFEELLSAPG
jgi:glycosyltransferase involved in cell wall biosynthesis